MLTKLVSGYYGGQKLENGQPYPKPLNLGKCSHGGVFDTSQDEPTKGGINKDAGFYLFSPHANLHQNAVDLAIKHTKHFFENIRSTIGDAEYSKFLNLIPSKKQFRQTNVFTICSATNIKHFHYSYLLFIILYVFYYVNSFHIL